MQTHQCIVFKAVDARRVESSLIDQAAKVVVIAEPANTTEHAISRHIVDG